MKYLLKSAIQGKRRRGQKELIKYLKGEKITRQQAINAQCYDCNGMGDVTTCDITTCSLYPYSPYKTGVGKGTL